MKRIFPFMFLLILVFLLSISCVVALVDYPGVSPRYPTEQFQRSVPLKLGGTLSLINGDGPIEIYGWDREEVEIFAENVSPGWQQRRIRVFSRGHFKPRVEVDTFEDFVKIKTLLPADETIQHVVRYELNVPQSVILKEVVGRRGDVRIADLYGEAFIELEEGEVKVENFSGSLTVTVVRGSVILELLDLRSADEIRVTIDEGDITVYLQPEAEARVVARAPYGSISSEFDLPVPLPANEVSGQIGGKEGAFLSLEASSGDIQIRKIE
jgi:hypothetical protein